MDSFKNQGLLYPLRRSIKTLETHWGN